MALRMQLVTLVPVRQMGRAWKFYTKSLGAKPGERGRGAMRNFWGSVQLGGCDVWLIRPEEREPRRLAYSTLMVKNIRSAVKALQKRKVRFQRAERMSKETRVEGPIAFEEFGASAFFKDSEGNLLMLWQNATPM